MLSSTGRSRSWISARGGTCHVLRLVSDTTALRDLRTASAHFGYSTEGGYILASPCGEEDISEMAQWATSTYTKAEIDRSAAKLVVWWDTLEGPDPNNFARLLRVVQNWRTSHGYPLNSFQMSLRSKARRIDPGVVIAQRLKRLSSVLNKLSREPHMRLTQMQDLGGCRAIVSDLESVYRLAAEYGADDMLTAGQRFYDYVKEPKPDGYRSFHIVNKYWSRNPTQKIWNGHKIEIQIRTQLQHSFATTVETVTTFTKQALKFGGGKEDWRRFFSLVGSAFAICEGTQLVEGTPHSESELVAELKDLAKKLNVQKRLLQWRETLKLGVGRELKDAKWLLLQLNLSLNNMTVTAFSNRMAADVAIAKIEGTKTHEIDAVLVWVDSFRELRRAYPNYYADTEGFLETLDRFLSR